MDDDRPTVRCEVCGKPTHYLGTKLCDKCWNVDGNLPYFARSAEGRKRLRQAALDAERKAIPGEEK